MQGFPGIRSSCPRQRFLRGVVIGLLLPAALLLGTAACSPDEEEIAAARDAARAYIESLDLSQEELGGGFYALRDVEHVNLSHRPPGQRQAAIAIVIVQNDQIDPSKEDKAEPLTSAKQVLHHSKAFFRANLCPGADYMKRFGEDFEVYVKLYSRHFGRYYQIPCN